MIKANFLILKDDDIQIKEHNSLNVSLPKFQNVEFAINRILEVLSVNYESYSKVDKFSKLSNFLSNRDIKYIYIKNMENVIFWSYNDLRTLFSILSENFNNDYEINFILDSQRLEELLNKEDELSFVFQISHKNFIEQEKEELRKKIMLLFKYFNFYDLEGKVPEYKIENFDLIIGNGNG